METELQSGLSQVFFMDKLAQLDNVAPVAEQLKQFAKILFHSEPSVHHAHGLESFRGVLVGPESSMQSSRQLFGQFLKDVHATRSPVIAEAPQRQLFDLAVEQDGQGTNTWFRLPYRVASTASCALTVPWSHPDSVKYKVQV